MIIRIHGIRKTAIKAAGGISQDGTSHCTRIDPTPAQITAAYNAAAIQAPAVTAREALAVPPEAAQAAKAKSTSGTAGWESPVGHACAE